MDTMRPKLTRIGDMCFRRLDIPNDGIIDHIIDHYNQQQFPTQDNCVQNKVDDQSIKSKLKSIDVLEAIDSEDDIEDISAGNGNRFMARIKVKKFWHKFIVGNKGLYKQKIESQTQTRIEVPKHTDLTSDIVITGNDRQNVMSARLKIKDTVRSARERTDFTHFVSIAMNEISIRERFISFKNKILNDIQLNRGIDDSLFQSCHKLHLTVVPILLIDESEREIASKIMDDCLNSQIKGLTNGQPLRVKLEGIDYMNDDPTQVDVLFAKVVDISDNQCLQSICDHLLIEFEKSGLIYKSRASESVSTGSKVKMHITLLNSKFRIKDNLNGRADKRGRRVSFDATHILNRFSDYYFGETIVESIDISIRHSNGGTDAYYSHSKTIKL